MKSQVELEEKTKVKLTKDQAEKAWVELDKYRKKLTGIDLGQLVAADRNR
ncbi:MAG: hypothetical protein Q8O75_02705 [bacterium]|nr:hypothetical protein [bacterium]